MYSCVRGQRRNHLSPSWSLGDWIQLSGLVANILTCWIILIWKLLALEQGSGKLMKAVPLPQGTLLAVEAGQIRTGEWGSEKHHSCSWHALVIGLFLVCTYMFMCAYVHVCIVMRAFHVFMCIFPGQGIALGHSSGPVYILGTGFLLGLELTKQATLDNQLTRKLQSLLPWGWDYKDRPYMPGVFCRSWGLNSGPCVAQQTLYDLSHLLSIWIFIEQLAGNSFYLAYQKKKTLLSIVFIKIIENCIFSNWTGKPITLGTSGPTSSICHCGCGCCWWCSFSSVSIASSLNSKKHRPSFLTFPTQGKVLYCMFLPVRPNERELHQK